MSTRGLDLAGREPASDRYHLFPVPLCFLGQFGKEAGPRDIVQGASPLTMSYHAFDIQRLDKDHIVVVDEIRAALMKKVVSLVGFFSCSLATTFAAFGSCYFLQVSANFSSPLAL